MDTNGENTLDNTETCLQYPVGKRDGGSCDLYWHGASYFETPDLQCGRVNKFPGDNLLNISILNTCVPDWGNQKELYRNPVCPNRPVTNDFVPDVQQKEDVEYEQKASLNW